MKSCMYKLKNKKNSYSPWSFLFHSQCVKIRDLTKSLMPSNYKVNNKQSTLMNPKLIPYVQQLYGSYLRFNFLSFLDFTQSKKGNVLLVFM